MVQSLSVHLQGLAPVSAGKLTYFIFLKSYLEYNTLIIHPLLKLISVALRPLIMICKIYWTMKFFLLTELCQGYVYFIFPKRGYNGIYLLL